jgi:thiamine biosynthesis protein ThiS
MPAEGSATDQNSQAAFAAFSFFRVMEAGMQVMVNGESADIKDGCTVAELLDHLLIARERVAVEVGLEIIPKAHYDTRTLSEGDRVEIVHFVGGGQGCVQQLTPFNFPTKE